MYLSVNWARPDVGVCSGAAGGGSCCNSGRVALVVARIGQLRWPSLPRGDEGPVSECWFKPLSTVGMLPAHEWTMCGSWMPILGFLLYNLRPGNACRIVDPGRCRGVKRQHA